VPLQPRGATVDKFIGDAVLAFWGAPNPLHPGAEALTGRNFTQAITGFERALPILPSHGPAKVLLGLSRRYLAEPGPLFFRISRLVGDIPACLETTTDIKINCWNIWESLTGGSPAAA
jgi:class 3 adenylate cyclase